MCLNTVRISECRSQRHASIDNRLWTVYIVLRQNVQWIPENRRVNGLFRDKRQPEECYAKFCDRLGLEHFQALVASIKP